MITPESTREEVLTVLGRNGFALFAASNEIRGDKAVFRAAMEQLEVNLDVAEDASYRDIVLAAVTRNRDLLNLASDEMKADKKIFLAAIRQLGVNLDVAEDASYRDVVLAAVEQSWFTLQVVSDELRKDKEVVLKAIEQNGEALIFADDDEIRGDFDVAMAAVKKNPEGVIHLVPQTLREYKEVAMAAVRQNGKLLGDVAEEFREDTEVVLAALHSGGLIHDISEGFPYYDLINPIIKAINKIEYPINKHNELQYFLCPAIKRAVMEDESKYLEKLIALISVRTMEPEDRLKIIGADTIKLAQQHQDQESSEFLLAFVNSFEEAFVQEWLAQQQPVEEQLLEAPTGDEYPQPHEDAVELAGENVVAGTEF